MHSLKMVIVLLVFLFQFCNTEKDFSYEVISATSIESSKLIHLKKEKEIILDSGKDIIGHIMVFKMMGENFLVVDTIHSRQCYLFSSNGKLIKKIGFGAAKKLIKKMAIKTTVIFVAKDASDTFSSCYHVGYLIDHAHQARLAKHYSPVAIRKAVDSVCSQFDTSLVNRVFFQVLRESASLIGVAKDFLVKVMIGKSSDKSSSDNISEEIPTEAMDVVEMIRTKLDLLPPSYFIELRQRFTEELAKDQT